MPENIFNLLLSLVRSFAQSAADLVALQNYIVEVIPQHLLYYNWNGFYMLDPNDADMLVLGPFHRAPMDHVRIPVSQGVCGAAVAQDNTVIVDDVHSDSRYLACSIETISEIVVSIRAHGKVIGEIDIDSHNLVAFSPNDRRFLEKCDSGR